MHILVIGGGIGGLAAAIALRQAGHTPVVYERAPELREVGAGITLWTNATRVLQSLGVGEAITAAGTPLRQSEVRSWDGRLISELDLGSLGNQFGAPTMGIHRADLQQILAQSLGAESLILGAACVSVQHDAEGVTARFADGREVRGDLLIGADGLKSVIRGQLLGVQRPRYAGYTAWRGVGLIDRPEVPLGITLLTAGRGSQFGYLPIGGGRTYWFATMNSPEGMYDPPGTVKTALGQRFADWYAPIPAVIDATEESAIVRNDILDRPPVTKWGIGRVTLLGDAAHPTTPNLGQGACMAIEDAKVLARCLGTSHDPVAGLREYERQRFARTAMVTNQSWRIGKMLGWESGFWCRLRDSAMRMSRRKIIRDTERMIGFEV